MSFVRGYNPIWFMNNLTAEPMDDTYYAFFLENITPYDPQFVFQDQDGNIPWANPIEFQLSSGLPDNIYFDPSLTYRIEIRKGATQSDPLIYSIQNYSTSAGNGGSSLVQDDLIFAQNMITNPQFADISFTSPIVYTLEDTYDIAPGWQLELVGAGQTTVTRVSSPGSSNNPGNPTYFLTFASSGWTEVKLIQTFSNNGAIFGGGACAVAFDAYSTGGLSPLTVSYVPSSGAQTTLFNLPIPTGSSVSYADAKTIPASTNANTGTNAAVSIIFTLPESGTISLSNIQITGQSKPLSQGFLDDPKYPLYHEQTYERTVDQEFHVYKNSILLQSKSNLLTGWTFPLNPWQFTNPAITNVSTNGYTADQTVIVQQNIVNGGSGNNIAVGKGSNAQGKNFVVRAVTNTNKFAMIQYIDPETISPYWGSNLSLFIKAYITTFNASNIRVKAKLIYNLNLPSTIGNNEPILSWTPSGEPIFTSGWTVLSSLNDPTYTLGIFGSDPFLFNKFSLPGFSSDNMTLGVVIYTLDNMATSGTPDNIVFQRVSLTPNDYAIDASVETYQESLSRCRRFYETSYQLATDIGTVTNNGAIYYTDYYNNTLNSGGVFPAYYISPSLIYKERKIKSPALSLYSPLSGLVGKIQAGVLSIGQIYPPVTVGSNPVDVTLAGTYVPIVPQTKDGFTLRNVTNTFISINAANQSNFLELVLHYIADSRLGI